MVDIQTFRIERAHGKVLIRTMEIINRKQLENTRFSLQPISIDAIAKAHLYIR